MSDDLDAKYAFAFGIDLQSQLAAMQLEDRQIIRRFLERNLSLRGASMPPMKFRTTLVSDNGFDGLQVQGTSAAVN